MAGELSVIAPPALGLTHTPLPLRIASQVLGAPSKAQLTFVFNLGFINTGDYIEINAHRFTVGDTTTEGVFRAVTPAYSFAASFNQTPSVNYQWRAEAYSETGITITAILTGSYYNTSFVLSNPAMATLTSQVDGNNGYRGDLFKDSYRVQVEIYEGVTGNFNKTGTDNINDLSYVTTLDRGYSKENNYDFDLAPHLAPYFQNIFLPALQNPNFEYDTQGIRSYYCKVYELYQPAGTSLRETTGIKKIIQGSFPSYRSWNYGEYTDFSLTPVLPLSLVPDRKPVCKGEVDLLCFLFDTSVDIGLPLGLTLGALQVEVFLKDGTMEVYSKKSFLGVTGGKIYFHADMDHLPLSEVLTEDIEYYSVCLFVSTVQITKKVTYAPYVPDGEVTTFAFLSQLGVIETFTFSGEKDVSLDRQQRSYNRTLPMQPLRKQSIEQVAEILINEKIAYYTHPLEEGVFDYLQSLLSSTQVYRIDGAEYEPVKITEFSYSKTSKTKLYTLQIIVEPLNPKNLIQS